MKKFLTVLLAAVLVCGGMFTSCKQNDDNDDTPVVLEAADTFTATAGSTAAAVGDDIALSVAQATANTKAYTESLSYAWTKSVNSAAAESITLSNGKYTAVAADVGSVVFTCKITSASYGTGVTVSTSAVTVSQASTAPALTISGDAVSVTAGGAVSATITGTLANESFATGVTAAAGYDLSSYITLSDDSFLAAGYTITAAEAIAGGATSAKITVAGTAAASAVSGTFSVTISAASLTSGVDLTSSNTIAYAVTATSGGTTTGYSANIADITPASVNVTADKVPVTDGYTLANSYFTVENSTADAVWRTKSSTDFSAIKAIELGKATSSITFTVTGTATVTIGASSTGSSNASDAILQNSSGSAVAEKNGIVTVSGTSETDLVYENLSAGTYKFLATPATTNGRGVRILTLNAQQTN